ncbi:MAG: hypothetical protein CW691_05845 [Candidatus Bathyarchaeum sp.]|nr:hypothetical protein [Candidatus Bathyarchaeota archaeon]PVX25022.1 MAG: hypothetical protein CW691_05845 [Candidatus Bathyarchaeum sp.]
MGFFKMFKKPKTSVTLKLPKDTFSLGSNIDTTIIVSAKEEFDATEVRAELRCIEKVRRERWVYNERLRRNVRHVYWDTETLLSEDLKASNLIHIVPGFKKTFPLTVHIPASGRETLDGVDQNVTWFLKGVVAVDGRPDATSDTIELQIIRATAAAAKPEVRMVPCEYCKALMPETSSACPICGAPRQS